MLGKYSFKRYGLGFAMKVFFWKFPVDKVEIGSVSSMDKVKGIPKSIRL